MLVWLASYPRSGNTFVRHLLKQSFDLNTHSINEGDDVDFGDQSGLKDIVGHVVRRSGKALLEEAKGSDELYLIKTHETPDTDDPAIYIVRDGRSSCVSYLHYAHSHGATGVTLEQIINGQVTFGSWSDHVDSWQLHQRPNTLLLRFEEIIKNPAEAVEQIGIFLNIVPKRQPKTSFKSLHSASPEFFRVGSDAANIKEMGRSTGLFVARHGARMRELGYMTDKACVGALEEYIDQIETMVPSIQDNYVLRESVQIIENNAHERYVNLFGLIDNIPKILMDNALTIKLTADIGALREQINHGHKTTIAATDQNAKEERAELRHVDLLGAINAARLTAVAAEDLNQLRAEIGEADRAIAVRLAQMEDAAAGFSNKAEEVAQSRHLAIADLLSKTATAEGVKRLQATIEAGGHAARKHLAAMEESAHSLEAKIIAASTSLDALLRFADRVDAGLPAAVRIAELDAEILKLKRAVLRGYLKTRVGWIGKMARLIRHHTKISSAAGLEMLNDKQVESAYDLLTSQGEYA